MPDASTTSLPVEFLCKVVFTFGDPMVNIDGPAGNRTIVTPGGGSFEGPKLEGAVVAPSADWATTATDGSLRVDVRSLWRTDDGADILVTYLGVGRTDSGFDIRIAPRFEVADERYTWLNLTHAVGFGTIGDEGIVYHLFSIA